MFLKKKWSIKWILSLVLTRGIIMQTSFDIFSLYTILSHLVKCRLFRRGLTGSVSGNVWRVIFNPLPISHISAWNSPIWSMSTIERAMFSWTIHLRIDLRPQSPLRLAQSSMWLHLQCFQTYPISPSAVPSTLHTWTMWQLGCTNQLYKNISSRVFFEP